MRTPPRPTEQVSKQRRDRAALTGATPMETAKIILFFTFLYAIVVLAAVGTLGGDMPW